MRETNGLKHNRKWMKGKKEPRESSIMIGPRCADGKVSYAFKKDAKTDLKRMASVGICTSSLQVFKCVVCGAYHLGTKSGLTRKQMRHNRAKRLA